jgi:acyl carrier protein
MIEMNVDALTARICDAIAAAFTLEPFEVAEDASTQSLAAWTSVAHLRLMAALEEEFAIELTTDEMIEMTGVAAIRETLARRGVRG